MNPARTTGITARELAEQLAETASWDDGPVIPKIPGPRKPADTSSWDSEEPAAQ